MKSGNFFAELKRRHVYKVGAAYAVAGWLVVQIVTQVFPIFEISALAQRIIVLAVVAGFPITLILSWLFDITSEGIVLTGDLPVSGEAPRARREWRGIDRKLNYLLGALLLVAVAYLAAERLGLITGSRNTSIAMTAIAAKSIAVLPFENLSDEKSNAYFADGIQDEILTKLASVADLKVISRTSTAKYKSKPEDLKAVAQQLGVATVLEGAVQRAGEKVRVNVQLIDARADSHLWAKSYDREIKDVFTVESEVAQEIAEALQAKLSPNEAKVLAVAPTKDSEAYDLFLRAEYEQHEADTSFKSESFDRAAGLYKQAIARDPAFALAFARLAEIQSKRNASDALSYAELEEVKKTAEHAIALAPDLAEAHIALGMFYYRGIYQYDPALPEFEHAIALQPNNVKALSYLASIHLRQGQSAERSLAEYKKCEQLDPRETSIANAIAGSYLAMGMWSEAKRAGLHALALDPHNLGGMHIIFLSELCGTGDLKEVARILQTFPPAKETIAYTEGGYLGLVGFHSYLATVNRDFATALGFWDNESNDPATERTRLCARVAIHVLAGSSSDASEIEKARGLAETQLSRQPDDVDTIVQLSWINLALHRNDEALRLVRHAAEVVPVKTDAVAGHFVLAALAEMEARTGHTRDAIEQLRYLLVGSTSQPACIERLRIDPVWDPIRNDPRFQELLKGKELVGRVSR